MHKQQQAGTTSFVESDQHFCRSVSFGKPKLLRGGDISMLLQTQLVMWIPHSWDSCVVSYLFPQSVSETVQEPTAVVGAREIIMMVTHVLLENV